jgi:hypothetical protein
MDTNLRGEHLDGNRVGFLSERRANLSSRARARGWGGSPRRRASPRHDLASDRIYLHVWKTRGCRGHGLAV